MFATVGNWTCPICGITSHEIITKKGVKYRVCPRNHKWKYDK